MWAFAVAFARFIASFFTPVFTFFFGWARGSLPYIAGFFGSSIVQLLIGLGWTVTSFTGFNVLTDRLLAIAVSGFAGLPSDIAALLGLMWVDKAINLILSSAVGLMTIKGLKAGTISRGAWHRPGSGNGGIDA